MLRRGRCRTLAGSGLDLIPAPRRAGSPGVPLCPPLSCPRWTSRLSAASCWSWLHRWHRLQHRRHRRRCPRTDRGVGLHRYRGRFVPHRQEAERSHGDGLQPSPCGCSPRTTLSKNPLRPTRSPGVRPRPVTSGVSCRRPRRPQSSGPGGASARRQPIRRGRRRCSGCPRPGRSCHRRPTAGSVVSRFGSVIPTAATSPTPS